MGGRLYQACLKCAHRCVYPCACMSMPVYTELHELPGKFWGTAKGNRFGVHMSFEDMLVKQTPYSLDMPKQRQTDGDTERKGNKFGDIIYI